jgi:putative ABC transport system substrate-binding protein
MRELGYVEGKTLSLSWRFAEGQYDRLPSLAAELVRANVDVILAGTTLSVQALRQASSTIPIVMVAVPDPVGEGFVARLARPGGNVTGLSSIVTEVSAKHLELLLTILPRLSRVAVLTNPQNPSDALILEQIQGAAYPRKVKVVAVDASTASQIEGAFATMRKANAEALIVSADAFFEMQREQIANLAIAHRIPVTSSSRELTQAGGLMSYGQDLAEHYRRAATYVDRILKGAKPGMLPVEQPTVLELVVNRKAAQLLGIALPQELVLRADRVIE